MASMNKTMVSPSEQVDHVWHLHQTFTAKYREDMYKIFNRLFKHMPALGGKSDSVDFKKVYENTLKLYFAMFGYHPPKDLWEPTEERFAVDLFNHSTVNLHRLANISLYKALKIKLEHSNTTKTRKELTFQ